MVHRTIQVLFEHRSLTKKKTTIIKKQNNVIRLIFSFFIIKPVTKSQGINRCQVDI